MIDLSSKINRIETIFQEYNIFKSVFVCSGNHIDLYYTTLLNNDFPVSRLDTLHKFNNHDSRILLLDEESVNNFDLLKTKIDISDINMVIYMDETSAQLFVENVPYFFLS